jgi:hypothetical protein
MLILSRARRSIVVAILSGPVGGATQGLLAAHDQDHIHSRAAGNGHVDEQRVRSPR